MAAVQLLLYAVLLTALYRLVSSAATSAFVDAGSSFDVFVPGTSKFFDPAVFTGTTNFFGRVFRAGRKGTDFTYSFDLDPGGYNVVLGFAEYVDEYCANGERIFNVYVNDEIQLEGLDVFDSAGGCFKGWETTISATVASVDTKPLTIRFESIMNPAMISIISISTAATGCVPVSDTGAFADGEDHAAHSVPGTYPPQLNANSPKSYVDIDGNGMESVFIDGSGSHTHFFDSANNIVGRLTDYTWTIVETGQVISKTVSFFYNFPLGTTRLKLAVVDNSCTMDEAETTVTVTGAIQQGVYCYYYQGLPKIIGGDPLGTPQFAAVSSTPNLGFPSFSFSGGQFVARCFFFLEIDQGVEEGSVAVSAGGGVARVYKGEDLLLDTQGMSSTDTELPVGLLGLEIIFERTAPAQTAAVMFKVQGSVPAASKVFYDQREVLPILSSLSPSDGSNAGGTSVKVSGFALGGK
ncbi:Malectin [Gracilaria domingensis]|nr:Malectin [Gracilaria domingensis]